MRRTLLIALATVVGAGATHDQVVDAAATLERVAAFARAASAAAPGAD